MLEEKSVKSFCSTGIFKILCMNPCGCLLIFLMAAAVGLCSLLDMPNVTLCATGDTVLHRRPRDPLCS